MFVMKFQPPALSPYPATPAAGALPPEVLAELERAWTHLERDPGLTARLANLLGTALGGMGRIAGSWGLRALNAVPGIEASLTGIAHAALTQAFDIAILKLGSPTESAPPRSSGRSARIAVMASGAAGGAAGLAGFAPDAAITTLAIMRRIARIAQEEGEDLQTEAGRRACLEVFALRAGLPASATAPTMPDAGYFPTRLLLQGAPLIRLMAEIAARYGMQLGQKLAAQAVPVVGAISGAAINTLFMTQFERLARAHFTIRRLERQWGPASIATAIADLNRAKN